MNHILLNMQLLTNWYNVQSILGILVRLQLSLSYKSLKTKVANSLEVREVQEGVTCISDKKLSKLG